MGTKFRLLLISLITITTFLFISCNDSELTAPKIKNTEQETNLKKEITPNAAACNQHIFYQWETSRYEPVVGKKLGFNPNSFMSTQDMKNIYGFSKVLSSSSTVAGFDISNIVAKVSNVNLTYPSGNFDSYHLDEAEEHDVSVSAVSALAGVLYPKKLILSSYKIGTLLDPLGETEDYYTFLKNAHTNVEIISDNYFGTFCADDQRTYWTDFQDAYGSSNKMNWMSLLLDGKNIEFNDLLGYANNRGFNEMWLYIGDAGDGICGDSEVLTTTKFNQYIDNFTSNAYSKGWLKRFEKYYRYEYRCYNTDPCETCDQENYFSEDWYFYSKTYMGQEREVFN